MRPDEPRSAAPAEAEIRMLDREECEEFLARHRVGRLAYAYERRLHIEPLHYIYDDGWIYGRTSPSDKLVALRHSPWVAFEVDDVHGLFHWTSVVAHGTFYRVDPEGTEADAATWRLGVELLRTIVPETLREGDPVPHRTVLFRIHVDELSGRAASPGHAAPHDDAG